MGELRNEIDGDRSRLYDTDEGDAAISLILCDFTISKIKNVPAIRRGL